MSIEDILRDHVAKTAEINQKSLDHITEVGRLQVELAVKFGDPVAWVRENTLMLDKYDTSPKPDGEQ